MKISIIFLKIYLLSVACSPNLDYSTNALRGVVVESNSDEEGNIGSIGGMRVLYPKDIYTVSGSTYSDTTTATINGVPAKTYAGPNGEIVVLIPENLKNGRLNIEVSNSNDSLTIDNVFHLNDSSIPLITADKSLICLGMQFYNANGVLTTGTKNCSGPADCTTDGEVGCVATSAVPGALATNLSPGDIRSGQTIGGVTGNLVLPSVVAVALGQQYGAGGTEFTGTASDMPASSVLEDVHPGATGGGIGAEPTTGLVNDGKAAVIHGTKVIAD